MQATRNSSRLSRGHLLRFEDAAGAKGEMMIDLELRDDVRCICPHCLAEMESLWMQELRGYLGRRYVYFCPQCRKVLGVSHRKGFFMG